MSVEQGTLVKWNAGRGFGFIKSDRENSDVFVHITSFGQLNRRPMVGDKVSYDVVVEQDGKRKARTAQLLGGPSGSDNGRDQGRSKSKRSNQQNTKHKYGHPPQFKAPGNPRTKYILIAAAVVVVVAGALGWFFLK